MKNYLCSVVTVTPLLSPSLHLTNTEFQFICQLQQRASCYIVPRHRVSNGQLTRTYFMASPQSAYVTAVPDDYDVEQPSSPTESEVSASVGSDMDFNPVTSSACHYSSPYTNSTDQPRAIQGQSSFDSVSSKSQKTDSTSMSLSQQWHQIRNSTSLPQTLSANSSLMNDITNELSHRDQVDVKLHQARSQHAYDEEQQRRVAWAMRMILTRPEENAEVCAAFRKAR